VKDNLGLDMPIDNLKNLILAGKPSDPPILVIQAFFTDEATAIAMANETARQLIESSPTNLTPAQQAQVALAREQMDLLNNQIQAAQEEIEAIDARLAADPNSTTQASPLTQQRTALITQVNQASANIAQFSATIADIEQQTHRLEIIEEATEAPFFRTGPGLAESMVISGVMGAVLAIVAILIIDYMDNTIRSSKDATTTVDLPVLGTIPQLGKRNEPYPKKLITNWSQRSALAESYRALQTNLLATSSANSDYTYLITSPGESEGKSVTAANLAVTMALNGLKVLLIDADLVKPRVHEIFALDNERGLKNLIAMQPSLVTEEDLDKPVNDLDRDVQQTINNLNACVQATGVNNLRVITSGPVSEDSTHLSEYKSLHVWMDVFRVMLGVDVIIFDTPPCLLVSDASILVPIIQADNVLVVQAGKTGRTAALQAQTQFRQVGHDFVGLVLNRVKHYDVDHGYNSGYFNNQTQSREVLAGQQLGLVKPDARLILNGAATEKTAQAEKNQDNN
jgi:Mrp family chromosome partitioning ATPase